MQLFTLFARKMRTASSIYRDRGWEGIREQISHIFRGRLGPSGLGIPENGNAAFYRKRQARAKKQLDKRTCKELRTFLQAGKPLEFATCQDPEISILLVLHNRAELTLSCLAALLRSGLNSFEVIIVDNASTDQTRELLALLRGVRIEINQTNLHYLRACNQGARLAKGNYLLLLNNDTQIQDNSIQQAIKTLISSPDVGAVGGKIVLPNGRLQEAGNIIWQDGSCTGYGRGGNPLAPAYMFKRDVDYCSGVFLLTPRTLFLEEQGFDEAYAPAYYEETDYCVRLWKRNLRVVYDPQVVIQHYEFASSQSVTDAIDLQTAHQKIFADRHREWLQSQYAPAPGAVSKARIRQRPNQKRILVVDDRVPHLATGGGFPRANRIVHELVQMGHTVTLWPLRFCYEDWGLVYRDIPREVEVLLGCGTRESKELLNAAASDYDCLLVSRPHNLQYLRETKPDLPRQVRIIYDAEAIFALREIQRLELAGKHVSAAEQERMICKEIALAEGCEQIVCVSDGERQEFLRRGFTNVQVLGHALECSPTPNDFAARRNILFVGALDTANSPNSDSVRWFCKDVFPRVRQQLSGDVRLIVAGRMCAELRDNLDAQHVEIQGEVADLSDLYNRARIFVAPTRYAGGIPYKVHEAAARGIPVVATRLIADQLGWSHETELLVVDDGAGFAAACSRLYQDCVLWNRLRENALRRVAIDCSPEEFTSGLREIIV